ncbi:Phosphotransferase enzyme family protein [Klenkia marina]|uniref:Phosphotransferase enzyme family protein n=1 Tax=Klenkia marina TaxID=1960309 RepID=A0A1G4XVU3_9ACTN|nr:phosphotransferase [Klenkia marina]SCX45312.1 Phosphotransferase enzyme family protein [Klenkia marina]
MTTAPLLVPAATPALAEGWPASLQLLLGEPAVDLWAAVLAPTGAALRSIRATSVSLRADGAATVQYAAELVDAAGTPLRDTLAATTGSRIPPGAAVVGDGAGTDVGLWRWPQDPALPALRWATSAVAVRRRLPDLGVPAEDARLRLRAHRPGRRAVVEVTAPAGRWFVKVVRPADLPGLVRRHELLAGHVPVPEVLATTADGVLVLPALPGTPMGAALDDPAARPGAAVLTDLLDRLPATDLPRVRGPLDRAPGHATVLGMVLPHLRPRLSTLVDALATAPGGHEVVPVHGDLYEAQLLLAGRDVVGLLDVDGAGAGHRIDDLANLLGHLAVLGQDGYRHELAAALPWPAAELAPRVAAVVLGLATGPFRVQGAGWPRATEARLALAERVLAGG